MKDITSNMIHNVVKKVMAAGPLTPQPQIRNPSKTFMEVRPLLTRMGISPSFFQPRYTEIESDKLKEGKLLYHLYMDRDMSITSDLISRLNRYRDDVEELKWSPRGIVLKVWHSPEEI